jgi:hypothetical protein
MCRVTRAWLTKPWKELVRELGVEGADHAALERHVHDQARAARKIDHHAAQGFVQRHIGVAVAADAFFVAHGLVKCLTQRDAHIFHRVVSINMQIAIGLDVEVDQPWRAIWSSMWSKKPMPVEAAPGPCRRG